MSDLQPFLPRIARNRAHRRAGQSISATAKPGSLKALALLSEFLTHGRSIVLNFLLVVLTIAIVWMAYQESQVRVVSINPIDVPESLAKRGYSAEVVSNRIGAHLRQIDLTAGTRMRREAIARPGGTFDIQIPGVGLNYQAVVRTAKGLLGIRDTRVSGDLVQTGEALEMRAVVSRPGQAEVVVLIQDNGKNIEAFLRTVAEQILTELRPSLLASYYVEIEKRRCRGSPSCDFSAAIRLYELVLAGDFSEDRKWALVGWAHVLMYLKKFDLAIEKATQAIEIDPEFSMAFNNWGVGLSRLRRHEEAIEKFRRAAELDSKFDLALPNWGEQLVALGRHEEAIEIFRQAIRLNLRDSSSYAGWGAALRGMKRYEEALQKFDLAAKLNSKDVDIFLRWGNTLHETGNFAEASKKYQRAAELEPNNFVVFLQWGRTLRGLGDNGDAVTKLMRANELDPMNPSPFYYWALLKDDDPRDMREKFRIAIELGLKGDMLTRACGAWSRMTESKPNRCP